MQGNEFPLKNSCCLRMHTSGTLKNTKCTIILSAWCLLFVLNWILPFYLPRYNPVYLKDYRYTQLFYQRNPSNFVLYNIAIPPQPARPIIQDDIKVMGQQMLLIIATVIPLFFKREIRNAIEKVCLHKPLSSKNSNLPISMSPFLLMLAAYL